MAKLLTQAISPFLLLHWQWFSIMILTVTKLCYHNINRRVRLLVKNQAQHSQLQRLYLSGLTGKSHCSTPGMAHSRCTVISISEDICHQGLRSSASHTGGIFAFPSSVPSFLGLFIWGLGQRSSSSPLPLRSPCGGQRGTSWTDFPHADSVPSTFPLLACPPCSPHCPSPRVQKPVKPFVWGSLNRGTTHPWTLNMHVIPWSKMEQEESSLPSFLDSCLYYCNEWLKTNSFIFNLVLSLPPAIHGSSLLSLPDGLSWCEHPSFSGWSSKH